MTRPARPVQPVFVRLDGRYWQRVAEGQDLRAQTFYDAAAGGFRLGDARAVPIAPGEPGGSFGGLTRPTGLAVGPDGRLFLADPEGNQILTYTVHTRAFVPLWPPRLDTTEDEAPCRLPDAAPEPPDAYTLAAPRGLAFSRDGDLVVADTGHDRLVVYTWPGLAPRHIIPLPEDAEPWDVAYDAAGWLYVAVAGRVLRYDRLWRLDETYEGGAGVLVRPRHLAFDADGALYVLDPERRPGPQILALDHRGRPRRTDDGTLPDAQALALHRRTFPPPLRLDADGLWLPQDEHPRCPELFLDGLEVDRRGRLVGAEAAAGRPWLLARARGVDYPRQGRYISDALDSHLFQCVWHRIVLDLDLPADTSVTVRTFTAPAERPREQIDALPLDRWSPALTITPKSLEDGFPEALVQSAPGRYLWLRLDLRSSGQATPLIRAVKIFAPRRSSLAFLPPVFREDPVAADFLDRFLSYFDTVFDEIETQIEQFTGFLDPDGVPAGDFLAWLGRWFDIAFLAEWPEATRRAFVREAIGLYKQRGTLPGLQAILRLHTGLVPPQPLILEHFRLRDYAARRHGGTAGLVAGTPYLAGTPLAPAADEVAHHFTVVLPEQVVPDDAARATVERLIEVNKPAHTRCALRVVRAGVRIGCQSTVGVDTLVGLYPEAPLDAAGLGTHSRLADAAPAALRLGHSRLLFSP